MSGHSKWSTIKRKKGVADAERSKIFQKLAKEIYVAAKGGDKNINNNAALRMVVEKAKAENMPKSNIQNAIDKANSKDNATNYEAITYEGYGPFGVAMMVECLTDNKNRTAGFVRSAFTKRNGNLGTDGSVSYMFNRKGIIVLEKKYNEDKLMEDVLELDIDDFITDNDGYTIYTKPETFIEVKDKLDSLGYNDYIMSEITFVPNNYMELDEESTNKVISLIDALEEIEDVQDVYHNLDI